MNQTRYYNQSKKEGLPKRCSILNRCQRRAFTIYFFSYHEGSSRGSLEQMIDEGVLSKDFLTEMVMVQGEAPAIFKGKDGIISFTNMCPEICLFDDAHYLPSFKEKAYVSGVCTEKGIVSGAKFRHYSECPEYCYYQANGRK